VRFEPKRAQVASVAVEGSGGAMARGGASWETECDLSRSGARSDVLGRGADAVAGSRTSRGEIRAFLHLPSTEECDTTVGTGYPTLGFYKSGPARPVPLAGASLLPYKVGDDRQPLAVQPRAPAVVRRAFKARRARGARRRAAIDQGVAG
jgi:hypothetical protein